MMNPFRILCCLISLMFLSSVTWSQLPFTIKGRITDTSRNNQRVSFSYRDGAKTIRKAATVTNGVFEFSGVMQEPSLVTLSMSLPKSEITIENWGAGDKTEFYMEGGVVTVEGPRLPTAKVVASGDAQRDFLELQAKRHPFEQEQKAAYQNSLKAMVARDSLAAGRFKALDTKWKGAIDSVEVDFMKKYPDSYVSLGLLNDRVNTKTLAEEKEKLAAWYNNLAGPLKASVTGTLLSERIQTAFKLAPGNPSRDFALNDTLGSPVRLSSFRGKYVLLDFWASWCIPCRFENKTVVKAYDRFKEKNFTVFSVSLEQPGDRQAWVAAIRKDGLTWPQVATLAEEERDAITKLYGVSSIPMNFLIDPRGNIVAVHLRGEELLKKLEDVLGVE